MEGQNAGKHSDSAADVVGEKGRSDYFWHSIYRYSVKKNDRVIRESFRTFFDEAGSGVDEGKFSEPEGGIEVA